MVLGTPRVFHKKYKFLVEIDEVAVAKFRNCSELSAEIDKIEQREGGSLIPNKDPGLVNFTDITLERGATDDFDLFTWFKLTQSLMGVSTLMTAAAFTCGQSPTSLSPL